MFNIIIFCKSMEMDHVKPSLVHDFFYIQSIIKEVIPNAYYNKYENKIKTYYSFTQEVFFEFMYKVNF
jgi:hypothetical protein